MCSQRPKHWIPGSWPFVINSSLRSWPLGGCRVEDNSRGPCWSTVNAKRDSIPFALYRRRTTRPASSLNQDRRLSRHDFGEIPTPAEGDDWNLVCCAIIPLPKGFFFSLLLLSPWRQQCAVCRVAWGQGSRSAGSKCLVINSR